MWRGQAPRLRLVAVLVAPTSPGVLSRCPDRCGDVTLSRAGPKPRQTRDGHSWRMGPLFSLCPRAPTPLLARLKAACGEGRGAESGPTSRAPPPASRRWRGRGLLDAAEHTPPGPRARASRTALPPRGGEGAVQPPRPCALSGPSVGAPGALQVVSQVPEAEPVVSFPAPGDPSVEVTPAGSCAAASVGGVESVRWRGSPLPRPLGRGVPCRSRSRVPSLPWVGEVARERRPGPAFGGAHPALPRASSTVAVSSRAPCEVRGPGEASAGGEPGRQHRPPRVLGRDGPGWPSPSPVPQALPLAAGVRTRGWCARRGQEPGLGRATPPSARKPSLAIREGAFGVPQPPAAAPPLCVSLAIGSPSCAPCGWGGPPSD